MSDKSVTIVDSTGTVGDYEQFIADRRERDRKFLIRKLKEDSEFRFADIRDSATNRARERNAKELFTRPVSNFIFNRLIWRNEMDDATIEAEIQTKGLNVAPRITKERIDSLMNRVVYRFDQPEGTTSTLAHAFLDGDFLLATGHSACVSKANFNAESGRKWAQAKADTLARDKLWELEGYALRIRIESANELAMALS
jgi:hypothetical protein